MSEYERKKMLVFTALLDRGMNSIDAAAMLTQDYYFLDFEVEELVEQVLSDAGHMLEIYDLIKGEE